MGVMEGRECLLQGIYNHGAFQKSIGGVVGVALENAPLYSGSNTDRSSNLKLPVIDVPPYTLVATD